MSRSDARKVVIEAIRGFDEGAFTVQELTVTAWMADRNLLGMPGFEGLYPCSKKVSDMMFGRCGLVTQGYLHSTGDSKYKAGVAALAR
jgi:hypothetical protein